MPKNRRSRMILTALGGLILMGGGGTAGAALAAEFEAVLTGDNEPAGGDSDGWGRARIDIDDTSELLCADLEVRSVGEVVSAQIYRGGVGETGTPVVKLDTPADDDSEDCDRIGDALADDIQSDPAAFYVSVTTRDYPGGAIRGQLGPSSD